MWRPFRAAQLGMQVALVERDALGNLFKLGCIPTKALLRNAEIYHLMQQLALTLASTATTCGSTSAV